MVIIWSNAVDKRHEHNRPRNRHPEVMDMRYKWGRINSNLGRAIRIPEYNQIIQKDLYSKKEIAKIGVEKWKQWSNNEIDSRKCKTKYKHYNYAILNYRNNYPGRDIIMNTLTCA